MNLDLTGLQNLPCADSMHEQKINQNFWKSLSKFSITTVTFLKSLIYTNVNITACESKGNSTITMAYMVKCLWNRSVLKP